MNKVLIIALVAAAGVLGWLALSKPEAPPPSARTPRGDSMSADEAPAGTAASASNAAAPASRPKVVMPPPPVTQAPALAPPVPAAGGPAVVGDPNKPSPYGRRPEQGMVEAPTADFKQTVRRYWGNLPKSGAVPAVITAEELLPPSVIAALNVPPQSRVTMLGDYPVGHPEAFKAVFDKPDGMQTMVGITVIAPDGKEIRDYVRLLPPAK
ncbi:hypothetical protein L6V77_20005 [Myxococcota bacterium]|nr:hypothetical protein [Myxococcota bacterium]